MHVRLKAHSLSLGWNALRLTVLDPLPVQYPSAERTPEETLLGFFLFSNVNHTPLVC